MKTIPKHEHTNGRYTKCLDCLTFGVGFSEEYFTLESESKCGNCNSLHTAKYYPICCIKAYSKQNNELVVK